MNGSKSKTRPRTSLRAHLKTGAPAGLARTFIRLITALFVSGLIVAIPTAAQAEETAARGQDVTIIGGKNRTIYEYYRGGVLHRIKVVPNFGRSYFLVPADETIPFGDLRRSGQLVPRWIVHEFRKNEADEN